MNGKREGARPRAPVPIFAKKQRQALLAHPNNVNSRAEWSSYSANGRPGNPGSYTNPNTTQTALSYRPTAPNTNNTIPYRNNSDRSRSTTNTRPYGSTDYPGQTSTTGNSWRSQNPNQGLLPNQNLSAFNAKGAGNFGHFENDGSFAERHAQSTTAANHVPTNFHPNRHHSGVPPSSHQPYNTVRQENSGYDANYGNITGNQSFNANGNIDYSRNSRMNNNSVSTWEGGPPRNTESMPWNGGAPRTGASPRHGQVPPGRPNTPGAQKGPTAYRFASNYQPQQIQKPEPSPSRSVSTSAQPGTARTGKNAAFSMEKKKDENTSLRVITTNIHGLKYWTNAADKLPVIFEVFGNLNSAVLTGATCAKEFNMKDEKDQVACVYFQIDRDMMRLVRGQWYRFMGKWQDDRLHVLSVKAMSEEERRVYKLRINACDRTMRTWQSKRREL